MRIDQGLIHIYTGDGKGKTTAALGLAFRALGWGLRVAFIQFIKGYADIGEMKLCEVFGDRMIIRQFAIDVERNIDAEKVIARRAEAEAAMQFAEMIVHEGSFDIVVLDELCVAVAYDLLPVDRVINLMRNKPEHVELVITGRGAKPEMVAEADYVTEMILIKHPYQHGQSARCGIDY
jgi:cob(I)alamin adenosyltransferase